MALRETHQGLSEPARPRGRFSCDLERAQLALPTRPRARTPRLALTFKPHHYAMKPFTHA